MWRKLGARLSHWRSPLTASRVYCTYLDSAYLARGIVMLRSLRRHDPSAQVVVLGLDELCARVLRAAFGDEVRVIERETLHAAFPELSAICRQRSQWACYETYKPALALFAMDGQPRHGAVICIDADTWFLGDPRAMLEEIGGASIGLSPHRFPPSQQHLAKFGDYNAGCIYFRNDSTGRHCLSEWRDDCFQWCDETAEPDGRFMSQGYLTSWPRRYAGVHVLRHPGSNLAPWNVDSHKLTEVGGRVKVDDADLVFYHFSGMSRDNQGHWFSHYPLGRQADFLCRAIYQPYILALEAESGKLGRTYGIDGTGSVRAMSAWPTAFQFKPLAGATSA